MFTLESKAYRIMKANQSMTNRWVQMGKEILYYTVAVTVLIAVYILTFVLFEPRYHLLVLSMISPVMWGFGFTVLPDKGNSMVWSSNWRKLSLPALIFLGAAMGTAKIALETVFKGSQQQYMQGGLGGLGGSLGIIVGAGLETHLLYNLRRKRLLKLNP